MGLSRVCVFPFYIYDVSFKGNITINYYLSTIPVKVNYQRKVYFPNTKCIIIINTR